MSLLGVFALVAVVLAAVGVYGVISHSVAHARRELGIRMALGADRRDILSPVLSWGLIPAGLGVAFGLLAAYSLTRLLTSLLVGIAPKDPRIFSGMAIILFLIALLACYIPARRASRIDPLVVLRQE